MVGKVVTTRGQHKCLFSCTLSGFVELLMDVVNSKLLVPVVLQLYFRFVGSLRKTLMRIFVNSTGPACEAIYIIEM